MVRLIWLVLGVASMGAIAEPTNPHELLGHSNKFLSAYFEKLPKHMDPKIKCSIIKTWLKKIYIDDKADHHISDGLQQTVITLAAFIGDEEFVDWFLCRPFKVNEFKDALAHAVIYPFKSDSHEINVRIRIINKLLMHGANIEEKGEYYVSPLFRAADFQRWELVNYLLDKNAKIINATSFSDNILIKSVASCDQKLIDRLVDLGARFSIPAKWETEFLERHLTEFLRTCNDPQFSQYINKLFFEQTAMSLDLNLDIKDPVLENKFITDRFLSMYAENLNLTGLIEELAANDLVIDGGSGATWAIRQLIEKKPGIKAIGITYTVKDEVRHGLLRFCKKHRGEMGLCLGDFNEMSNEDILKSIGEPRTRKAKLIFDFWGIFAYSRAPDKILKRYLDLLDDDGVIAITVGAKYYEDLHTKINTYIGRFARKQSTLYRSLIKKANGETVTLPEWLSQLPGIMIDKMPNGVAWHIRKRPLSPALIPTLKYIDTIDRTTLPEGHLFEEESH